MLLIEEKEKEDMCHIFYELILEYRESNNKNKKKWVVETLKIAIRQLELFLIPKVSVEANRIAQENGINNLKDMRWKDQEKKMKDKDRKIFHFEHVFPVAQMKDELLNLQVLNIENIKQIIDRMEIAWILKEENKKLDKKGYSFKRGDNIWECYKKVGIEMIK